MPEPGLFPNDPKADDALENGASLAQIAQIAQVAEERPVNGVVVGPHGIRVGWSALVFLFVLESVATLTALWTRALLHGRIASGTDTGAPTIALVGEAIELLGVVVAGAFCARLERRRVLDYNLKGPSRLRHFFTGAAAGFVSLSALVGAMVAGGWLRLGPATAVGMHLFEVALLWGVAMLLTGFAEEGAMRCYLLFTLARGINFWWALGIVSGLCAICLFAIHNDGVIGVYAVAGLGVLPCFWLHRRRAPGAGFWQAAWATSAFFGFIHTGNNGENWIGIFTAAVIGFVFCVSVRLTGSAWWAIGFHGAWDWAETFFYGTSDSGMMPIGHYFTTSPSGSALWSGGTDGPEGSLLVLPVVVLTLAAVVAVYGRRGARESGISSAA